MVHSQPLQGRGVGARQLAGLRGRKLWVGRQPEVLGRAGQNKAAHSLSRGGSRGNARQRRCLSRGGAKQGGTQYEPRGQWKRTAEAVSQLRRQWKTHKANAVSQPRGQWKTHGVGSILAAEGAGRTCSCGHEIGISTPRGAGAAPRGNKAVSQPRGQWKRTAKAT